jgi:hypothetical protein
MDIGEKIKAIEEEIRRTPYNKATQHHIGRLKTKLARLKEDAQKRSSRAKGKGYSIRKAGDATVVLAGFPSVGKSTLLNKLTDAGSEVAAYDFTTLRVVPGVMNYRGARIQILDIPGLMSGASSGKGRGKEALSVVKNADLILLLLDVFNLQQYQVITRELYDAGIRLNQRPPDVRLKKKDRGGISISSTVELTKVDEIEIKGVLSEYKVHNADVVIREDLTIDRFIDALAKNRYYIPSLTILNKIDLVKEEFLEGMEEQLGVDFLPISAKEGTNLERLRQAIYDRLDFIRVYMKPQGGKADLKEPMIVVRGSTVGDVCDRIHKELRERFRYAKVWGGSVKFDGQRASLKHVLEDGDVVTIVARN